MASYLLQYTYVFIRIRIRITQLHFLPPKMCHTITTKEKGYSNKKQSVCIAEQKKVSYQSHGI